MKYSAFSQRNDCGRFLGKRMLRREEWVCINKNYYFAFFLVIKWVRGCFYLWMVSTSGMEGYLSTKEDFLSSCGRVFIWWQISHTRCGESRYKEKDKLSPGVRKSFYSGRVQPHMVRKDLFGNKRTSFHHVWESPFMLAESRTRCGEISLETRGLLFTRCEEILLFWQSPTPSMEGSLWKEKDFLSSGVRNPCILAESSTACVWVSLWKEKDFLSPGVRKSFYSGRVPTHQVWRDLFRKKRTSFHQVWGDPFILAEFTHTMCRKFSLERKRLSFTKCEEILLFWQSPTPCVCVSL